MTAATKTKPDTETLTFTSKRTELLVYLTPDRRVVHPDGTSETVKGVTAQFGPFGGFGPGQFQTDDPELAERLRKSPHFGEDFFEIKIEPAAPDSNADLMKIALLIANADVDGLVELERQEREGWARDDVFSTIEGAVEALRAREPDPQPEG